MRTLNHVAEHVYEVTETSGTLSNCRNEGFCLNSATTVTVYIICLQLSINKIF